MESTTFEEIMDQWEWAKINWVDMEEQEADKMEGGNGTVPGSVYRVSKSSLANSGSGKQTEQSSRSPTLTSNKQNTTDPLGLDVIHTCLKLLAGKCDGAYTLDGQGFNKFDAKRGHELADQDKLSEKDRVDGVRMVRKYHKQIPTELYKRVPIVGKRPSFTGNAGAGKKVEPKKEQAQPARETPFDGPKSTSTGRKFRRLTIHSQMPFGKHKGETFQEIAESAPDYLRYIIENFDDDKQDIIQAAELALEYAGEDY